MSFIFPCSIVVLVNRYLTVCVNNWSDEFNYIVCNEEALVTHWSSDFGAFLVSVYFGKIILKKSRAFSKYMMTTTTPNNS